MSFLAELKRRNVIRMAALYVMAAWLIVQVADVIIGMAALPDWIGQGLLVVLALGFPISLVFAWVYEITPTGVMRESEVERSESITDVTGRRMDFVIIAILVAAVAVFAWDKWGRTASNGAAAPPNSIAVLPFVNRNADPEQAYFSDGLSEELLNLLARVPELRVTSRTSAFSFRDEGLDVPTIASKLRVAHILEGSVRRSGDVLRITAQLIDTRSDVQLWSESYDRPFTDVFLIQDEIAAAVVGQLKVALLGEAPRSDPIDPEAYADYLRARHLYRQGSPESFPVAESLLRSVIERAPDYAPAWEGLSTVYSYQASVGQLGFEEGYAKAAQAVRRALAIDPDFPMAHAHLGWDAMVEERDFPAAAAHFRRARELAPSNSAVLGNSGLLAFTIGRLDEAVALLEQARILDPVDPSVYGNLGSVLMARGDLAAADAALTTALGLSPGDSFSQVNLAMLRLLQDRAAEALSVAESIDAEVFRLIVLPMAYHSLGRFAESDEALAQLEAQFGGELAAHVAGAYAWRGQPDAAFEWLQRAIAEDQEVTAIKADPILARLHGDPRWAEAMTVLGLDDASLEAVEL